MRILVAFFAASSVLHAQAGTQRPPTDTTARDTAPAQPPAPRDSVKTPFTFAEAPHAQGIGKVRWGRDEIFQTGAINLAELIARVPGAAIMRSGFAMAPQTITWWGETGRVRVFLDGTEIGILNAREGTVQDLGAIPVFSLEEVIAETTPGELRVHLRSWRVDKTAAETRVDVLTGDQETNLYRGYIGRRFQSGLGIQLSFEQTGTEERTLGGDGDGFAMFGRLGWARGDWSIDITALRNHRSRHTSNETDNSNALPSFDGTRTIPYVRLGYRNPDTSGVWAQLIATRDAFKENSSFTTTAPVDSGDTSVFRPQYIAAAGITIAGVRASATMRMLHADGENFLIPSARVSMSRSRFGVYAFAERSDVDSTLRGDGGVQVSPLVNRLVLDAQASLRNSTGDGDVLDPDGVFFRATAAVRLWRLWFSGGVIQRDSVVSHPPIVYQSGIVDAHASKATGQTAGISGAIYKDFGIDAHAELFKEAGYFRPKTRAWGRLYLESDWRSKFPKGHFTIRASLIAERIGEYLIPLEEGDVVMPSAMPFTSILEIRIKSATLSWQFRNLAGARYQTVPGFTMPSRVNLYGVRWNFSN